MVQTTLKLLCSNCMAAINLLQGDITKIKVDAIVNAANNSLLGGGGVDGAIHKAAGPELLEACKKLDGCATGNAKITKGYNLPSEFIIHTVGPIWRDGNYDEKGLLKACYLNSLSLANEYNISTLAFPNISTGIYGFPKKEAATIAIGAVTEFLAEGSELKDVLFVCFDQENYLIYKDLLN